MLCATRLLRRVIFSRRFERFWIFENFEKARKRDNWQRDVSQNSRVVCLLERWHVVWRMISYVSRSCTSIVCCVDLACIIGLRLSARARDNEITHTILLLNIGGDPMDLSEFYKLPIFPSLICEFSKFPCWSSFRFKFTYVFNSPIYARLSIFIYRCTRNHFIFHFYFLFCSLFVQFCALRSLQTRVTLDLISQV